MGVTSCLTLHIACLIHCAARSCLGNGSDATKEGIMLLWVKKHPRPAKCNSAPMKATPQNRLTSGLSHTSPLFHSPVDVGTHHTDAILLRNDNFS